MYAFVKLLNYLLRRLHTYSNTAGNDIAEESIQHWTNGNPREKITLKEMEKVIQLPALNAKSKFANTLPNTCPYNILRIFQL